MRCAIDIYEGQESAAFIYKVQALYNVHTPIDTNPSPATNCKVRGVTSVPSQLPATTPIPALSVSAALAAKNTVKKACSAVVVIHQFYGV